MAAAEPAASRFPDHRTQARSLARASQREAVAAPAAIRADWSLAAQDWQSHRQIEVPTWLLRKASAQTWQRRARQPRHHPVQPKGKQPEAVYRCASLVSVSCAASVVETLVARWPTSGHSANVKTQTYKGAQPSDRSFHTKDRHTRRTVSRCGAECPHLTLGVGAARHKVGQVKKDSRRSCAPTLREARPGRSASLTRQLRLG